MCVGVTGSCKISRGLVILTVAITYGGEIQKCIYAKERNCKDAGINLALFDHMHFENKIINERTQVVVATAGQGEGKAILQEIT